MGKGGGKGGGKGVPTSIGDVKETLRIVDAQVLSGGLYSTMFAFSETSGALAKVTGSSELERWSEDSAAVYKTLSGEMSDDKKRLTEQQELVEDITKEYNSQLSSVYSEFDDEMERLMFFPEIFAMAIANELDQGIDSVEAQWGPKYSAALAKLEKLQEEFQEEYDFMLNLSTSAFVQKIVAGIIMIIGGLVSDMGDIRSGKAKSGTYSRIITTIVKVIIIALFIMSGPAGWVAAALLIANLIIELDGYYANGVMLGAVFTLLDLVFNDILNLDDRIGSDFGDFDKNSDGYASMQAKFKIVLAIAAIIATWTSSADISELSSSAIGADTAATIGTFSSLYQKYQLAVSAKNIVEMYQARDDITVALVKAKAKIDASILEDQKAMRYQWYKDVATIQTDTNDILQMYQLQISGSFAAVDTGEMRIPMNSVYEPDGIDDQAFGFEEFTNPQIQAGSDTYSKDIIIGSAYAIG